MASDIRGNSGFALIIRDGDKPTVSLNAFARNGGPDRGAPFLDPTGVATFSENVFVAATLESFAGLDNASKAELKDATGSCRRNPRPHGDDHRVQTGRPVSDPQADRPRRAWPSSFWRPIRAPTVRWR
jgi:hypothetical protein